MLDEDAEEALEGAEDRAVEHDGAMLVPVFGRVRELEAVRVREVHLQRAELPRSADRVRDLEVELRPVERAVARVQEIRPAGHVGRALLEGLLERLLGLVPVLDLTHELLGARAEADLHFRESERPVNLPDEVEEAVHLGRHLVERAVEVRVVLRERADACQALRDTRPLVAVEAPEIRESDREIAVAVGLRGVEKAVARAVHGLHAELALVDLREVHVLFVVLVVPGDLEELGVEDLRRDDLLVAVLHVQVAHVAEEEVVDRRTLRQEERRGGREGMEDEKPELLAELAVIAGLRRFEALEVLVEILLRQEHGAVNALQHRIPLVAFPVGAGRMRKLEDAEPPRGRDVRAAAKVDEVLLLVAREAALGNARDDLDLQRVVLRREDRDGLGLRHLPADDDVVLDHDLLHLGLDLLEVLGREGTARIEIVVEAVLDRGADPDLDAREEALDRVRAEMRRRVPIELERVRMLRRHDLEPARRHEGAGNVEHGAVQLDAECVLCEPGADRLGDGTAGGPLRNLLDLPVRQRQANDLAFRRLSAERRAFYRGHT